MWQGLHITITYCTVKIIQKNFCTSITAKADRKIAESAFLDKELIISAMPFATCMIACIKYLTYVDNISKSLINGFIRFKSDLSLSVCLFESFLLERFPSTTFCTTRGANIAGATRIRAATLSGASKYVLTATREPAECLPQFEQVQTDHNMQKKDERKDINSNKNLLQRG